jgi:diguanylate cyclase (GGDEF)-like protein
MWLARLIPGARLNVVGAALVYGAVFALFLVFERPGLGIGHGFYIAIILVALAAGPWSGAAAGGFATALYALGMWINPHVPSTTIPTVATSIRAVSYVAVGVVVGLYATRNRTLNQRLTDMTHKLQTLAERDVLTGLPNTRAFESAITRRLENDQAFALLIGDIDGLRRINTTNGYNEGNDLLRQVAERLTHKLPADSEIARVGDDEFAILMPCEKSTEAARYAAQLELYLDSEGARVTLGWALHPQEGSNALALYRIADERLYARKLMRGERRSILQLIQGPTLLQDPAQDAGGSATAGWSTRLHADHCGEDEGSALTSGSV